MPTESNAMGQEVQFIWRRLEEPLQVFGKEISGYFWLALLIPLFLAAVAYVVWMYVRDSRSVGWRWATFLGVLRCAVYLLLGLVFLLPSYQTWDKTESKSRVVVLLDISGSMGVKDDLPSESMPAAKLPSRRDKLIRFLTNDQIAFLKRLEKNNPVFVYRFGERIDEQNKRLENDVVLSTAQWNDWSQPKPVEIPANLDKEERAKLERSKELVDALVKGTNYADALSSALNREANNMVQGIVVFGDGRSTQFSAQVFEQVRARAQRLKMPIFSVAVGEARPPINIRITELQAPEQARPDDKFPIRIDVDGEGKAGEDVKATLEIFKPKADSKKEPSHKVELAGKFSKDGSPPHAQLEVQIDPAQLPAELRNPDPSAKPELEEGEWKFRARVAKDRREVTDEKEHVSDLVSVNVVKKPLRVLLFASGPTREYQFVRTLFVREKDHGRANLSICLQLARDNIVQDVPAEQMLKQFPTTFRDVEETAENKYDNLAMYDVIIAFDPNWMELTPPQMELLEKWVGQHAGGLILIAGPIHTYELAKGLNYAKVKPILDLYPVVLDDSRLPGVIGERSTADPYRLLFLGANKEMEFLRLNEDSNDLLSGWEEFFTGQQTPQVGGDTAVRRGIYSAYPVKDKKPSATVIATYTGARMSDGRNFQPYLVYMPYQSGKVFYLGSGEMWRLRQCREAYHERFWTKLARFIGSGNLTKLNTHGQIVMSPTFHANTPVHFEAQLWGREITQPLGRNEKPEAEIKPPTGVTPATTKVAMRPKAGSEQDWNGWFEGSVLLTSPGTYELQLPIPGSSEILRRKFTVKEANPEMDNTMPDFVALRDMASPAADVLNRIKEAERAKVRSELERTNRLPVKEGTPAAPDADRRLYFDLEGAKVIPDCMVTAIKTQRSRGPVKDLWDDGFLIGDYDPPVKISYVLLIIVGLFSIEWLTRKLLKLA